MAPHFSSSAFGLGFATSAAAQAPPAVPPVADTLLPGPPDPSGPGFGLPGEHLELSSPLQPEPAEELGELGSPPCDRSPKPGLDPAVRTHAPPAPRPFVDLSCVGHVCDVPVYSQPPFGSEHTLLLEAYFVYFLRIFCEEFVILTEKVTYKQCGVVRKLV